MEIVIKEIKERFEEKETRLICDYLQEDEEWAKVVFSSDSKYPVVVYLRGSTITFGRDHKSFVRINYLPISRLHCELVLDNSVVFLYDHSANGTCVNRKQVVRKRRIPLQHGDVIHLNRPSKTYPEEVAFTILFSKQLQAIQQKQAFSVIGSYVVGSIVDVGSFAKVYNCTHQVTGISYAVKVTEKDLSHPRGNECYLSAKREAEFLLSLQHPHIIQAVEAIETKDHFCMVLELLTGGSVYDKMVESESEFTEAKSRHIFNQIVSALAHLHASGIVHRDLKLENILFVDRVKDDVKVIDFGLSSKIQKGNNLKEPCGSLMYVAPEVIENLDSNRVSTPKGYNESADIWSLGVILFGLLCGELPFNQKNLTNLDLVEHIRNGRYHIPSDLQNTLSTEAKNMIFQLLQVNPKKRITLEQIQQHPWIKKKESLSKIKILEEEKLFPLVPSVSRVEDRLSTWEKIRNLFLCR